VVPAQVIRDQAPRNLDDALYNVSGITQGNNFGGTADTVMKRGFGDNRDGSIMRDGMPIVQGRASTPAPSGSKCSRARPRCCTASRTRAG
jgi:iron complex outermembrane receptor protein